jgi:hypothetical protein
MEEHRDLSEKLSNMTPEEFLDLGDGGLSYIKITHGKNNEIIYALHTAKGDHIATGQDSNLIQKIALEQHLIPVSVQ